MVLEDQKLQLLISNPIQHWCSQVGLHSTNERYLTPVGTKTTKYFFSGLRTFSTISMCLMLIVSLISEYWSWLAISVKKVCHVYREVGNLRFSRNSMGYCDHLRIRISQFGEETAPLTLSRTFHKKQVSSNISLLPPLIEFEIVQWI